ncbi:UNVERIFIED_CONTAM: CASP-like protein 4A3 [Sesamum radiatum]|uniref:CASP-like protein n=1 Tax=Sesamum radiatum TaxID=300843 RepID=A0AAW2PIH3_SESRA
MENQEPGDCSKKTLRRSSNSHISMSDTESTTSQVDSWHSPLRSESPLRSDDPSFQQGNDNFGNKSNKSLVSVDKYYSPSPSPGKPNFQASSPGAGVKGWRPWPHSEKPSSRGADLPASPTAGGKGGRREKPVSQNHAKGTSPVVLGLDRLVREEPPPGVKKVGPVGSRRGAGLEEGYGGGEEDEVGGERRSRAAVANILRRSERSVAVRKAALAFRVFEAIACLISFSVMAGNKTQGWSGDSFDRYKEYRYCLAVNVIGFVYSGFQAYDLAYYLGTGKHIIAYLLISASSSAARVMDWILNWGKDEFTLMASASIAMSFLAFIAFAFSSVVSGYDLCNRDS